jgi:hypothetical protein
VTSVATTRGAWRAGDPVGHRRFLDIGPLDLEFVGHLTAVRIAYETWGTFTGDNTVLIQHALSGDSHVAGPAGDGHPTPAPRRRVGGSIRGGRGMWCRALPRFSVPPVAAPACRRG